jgi:FG-GAP repeat
MDGLLFRGAGIALSPFARVLIPATLRPLVGGDVRKNYHHHPHHHHHIIILIIIIIINVIINVIIIIITAHISSCVLQKNGRFGFASVVLDVNLDGFNDLVVSAPSAGSPTLDYYGRVYVYLGGAAGQPLPSQPSIVIGCTVSVRV